MNAWCLWWNIIDFVILLNNFQRIYQTVKVSFRPLVRNLCPSLVSPYSSGLMSGSVRYPSQVTPTATAGTTMVRSRHGSEDDSEL